VVGYRGVLLDCALVVRRKGGAFFVVFRGNLGGLCWVCNVGGGKVLQIQLPPSLPIRFAPSPLFHTPHL